MASLLLGAVGTYFGGPIGGIAGSMIGGLIDNALMPSKSPPQLSDLQVTGSVYGQPIPRIYGATRIGGNLIQSSNLKAVGSSGGGGKKGGAATTLYTATFAVGICAGPIKAIWRIWADGKIIYDARPAAVVLGEGIKVNATGDYGKYITIYDGTETQMPDPHLEALVGAGNQPGYRGLAYIVCTNFPVSDFGNRPPAFSFEILGLADNPSTLSFVGGSAVHNNDWLTVSAAARSLSAGTDKFGNMILCGVGSGFAQGVAQDGTQVWQLSTTQVEDMLKASWVNQTTSGLPGIGLGPHNFVWDTTGSTLTWVVAPICNGEWLYFALSRTTGSLGAFSTEIWSGIAYPTQSGAPSITACVRSRGPLANLGSSRVLVSGYGSVNDPILLLVPAADGTLCIVYLPSVLYTIAPPELSPLNLFALPALITSPIVSPHLAVNLGLNGIGLEDVVGWTLPFSAETDLYFYLNKTIMDYQAFTAISNVNYEIKHVLQPAHPGGCMININLGLLDYLDLWGQALALGGVGLATILNYAPPGATSYSVINSAFFDSLGAPALPFLDEHVYLSTGAAGGTDAYSQVPAYMWAQPDGSYLVAFAMKGINDSGVNLHGDGLWVSVRVFVYNPLTGAFIQQTDVVGLLYDRGLIGGSAGSGFYYDSTSVMYQVSPGVFVLGGFIDQIAGTLGAGTAYFAKLATAVGHGNVSLAAIVKDVCERCGLTDAQIDVTALESTTVDGYTITSDMSGRAALSPLQQIFFFDGIESDWIIKWKLRSGTPIGAIAATDLGARADSASKDVPKIQEMRANDIELPRGVQIKYFLPGIDYQVATQHAKRPSVTTNAKNILTISAAITMEPSAAKAACEIALYLAWLRREQYDISVPQNYLLYDPGDVVTLAFTDTNGYPVSVPAYITKTDIGADGVLPMSAQQTDAATYTVTAPGSAPVYTPQTGLSAQPVAFALVDGPLLQDNDDSPGFYTSAHGSDGNWSGGVLTKSTDGGASFAKIDKYLSAGAAGISARALAAVSDYSLWDMTNTITVYIQGGETLASVPMSTVAGGANNALIGSPSTGWELVGFANVTQISSTIFLLDTLLRGRQGTDWMIGRHAPGEQFIMAAQDGSFLPEALQQSEIGAPREYEAYSFGAASTGLTPTAFTCAAVRIKPLAPINPMVVRDGSNNITLTWTPRRRLFCDIMDGIDPGVDEAIEAYSTDIIVSGTVKRTIASSSPTLSYSAANQTTDGITPGNPVTLKIYQLSSRVGRGYPGAFTV